MGGDEWVFGPQLYDLSFKGPRPERPDPRIVKLPVRDIPVDGWSATIPTDLARISRSRSRVGIAQCFRPPLRLSTCFWVAGASYFALTEA